MATAANAPMSTMDATATTDQQMVVDTNSGGGGAMLKKSPLAI